MAYAVAAKGQFVCDLIALCILIKFRFLACLMNVILENAVNLALHIQLLLYGFLKSIGHEVFQRRLINQDLWCSLLPNKMQGICATPYPFIRMFGKHQQNIAR